MTILGTQAKQHRDHIENDAGSYESKVYTVTILLYPSEADKGAQVVRRKFEDELLNKTILAGGPGRLRVDTVEEA